MMPRFFVWLYLKLKPGWISLLLAAALVALVADSVGRAGWVSDSSAIGWALFLGALAGGGLAASRWSGWLALAYVPLTGLAFAGQAVGRVLPAWQVLAGLSFVDAVQLMNVRLFALFDRLAGWGALYRSGKSIGDTGLFVFAFCLLAWLAAAWLGWCVRRRRQAIAGLLPLGLLLGLNVELSGQYAAPLAGFIGLGLLLTVRTAHTAQHTDWERRQVDYPDDLGFNWGGSGFALALLIAAAAWAAPLVGTPSGWQALADLFKPAQQQVEDTAVRIFSQVNPPHKGSPPAIRADTPQLGVIGPPPAQGSDVVFWVSTSDPPPPPQTPGLPVQAAGPRHYWRSQVFAAYTGQGWTPAPLEAAPLPDAPLSADLSTLSVPPGHYALLQTFEMAARHGVELFAASQPQQAAARPALGQSGPLVELRGAVGDEDSRLVQASPGALSQGSGQVGGYSVISFVPRVSADALASAGTDYPPEIRAAYLQLPAGLPERVRSLAQRLGANAANPYELAMRIQFDLRITYPYSLSVPPPPAGRDVVDYFLFEAPGGFCSYYASAMAVLLRSQGVPARVATGFATGSYDTQRQAWAVPASAAHAWVEVYFPGLGWIEFDPTPIQAPIIYPGGAGSAPPVPPGTPPAFSLPPALTLALIGLVLALGIGLLAGLLRFLGRGPGTARSASDSARRAQAHYLTVRRALGWAGLAPQRGDTPAEFLDRTAPALSARRGLSAALERATALYQQAAYSPRPPAPGEVDAARQAWVLAFGEWLGLSIQHLGRKIFPGLSPQSHRGTEKTF